MTSNDRYEPGELEVPLYDAEGDLLFVMRFESLGLPFLLASVLKDGFVAQFGHTSNSAQRQSFSCIRKFASFLRSTGAGMQLPLPATIACDLRSWLQASGLAPSTAQSVLNASISVLEYCERRDVDILSRGTRLIVDSFKVPPTSPHSVPSEDMVKDILKCCYREIESIEARIATAKRLLAGVHNTDLEKDKAQIIGELLVIGHGEIPRRTAIPAALRRLVDSMGGVRAISQYIWISPRDLLPFYIAILIQTSGNAEAILKLKRSCVSPHPLRDDLERVVWEKPRSHREQRIEAPVGRSWSAASLIRRLANVNENLTTKCEKKDRKKLFISYMTASKKPCVPTNTLLYLELKKFVELHSLEKFSFSSLRYANAFAHFRANGSLADAKRRLNHVSIATTLRYADIAARRDHHDTVILGFQGLMARLSLSGSRDASPSERQVLWREQMPVDTVFGFRCRNPFEGIAEGSSPGNLCLQFHKCATCPGALIPLDNLEVVARLLATDAVLRDAHSRAIREGWLARFQLLYEPTRRILTEEILPAVSATVRTRAARMMDLRVIPPLE